MLGKGWFPAQLGGLDRYYRSLLEQLKGARGVVIGPGSDAASGIAVVSQHSRPLARRLAAFYKAAVEAAGATDLVDAHFALYAALPILSGRLRGKPLVVHFQGPWADENVAAGETRPLRTAARRALERAVYHRADIAITLTGAFRQLLVERYGVLPWKIRVLRPGVDLDRFSPGDRDVARARLHLPADAWLAVCVRRLVPRMGIEVLLEAWESAKPQLPAGAQLLIAGDGPLAEDLAERIEGRPSVRLLGRIGDEELVELYRVANLNIVPTLSFEGFGLVVTEAAACGTPSIVTDAGGLPEAVAGLDPSLVVAAGDPHALSERLVAASEGRLPSRPDLQAWAAASSWALVAEQHRALYRDLLSDDEHRDLRVLYIDHTAQLSGGEIALLRLLPHLTGVCAHVILAQDGPLVGRLHRHGVSVEVLPLSEAARDLRKDTVKPGGIPLAAVWQTVRYVVRLTRRLRTLQPDLVHTNSLKAGVYGTLAARLAGIPSIWHVRDRIDADYLPRPAVRLVRGLTRRLPARVIANSKATMATLQPARDSVVHDSVVPEVIEFPDAAPTRSPGALVVGIVGRITHWKGQHVFLEAFARAFPDGQQRAIVLGDAMFGSEEQRYAGALRAQVEQLGVADRVGFRGFRDDVFAELAEIDVLVHASITPEPFGQVILEGMAAGVPVVATRGGGPSEILSDGVNGLLYPPGDVQELARLLAVLDSDQELRERLAAAGLERARDFAPSVVSAKLLAIYGSVLLQAGRPRPSGAANPER